MIKVTCLLLLVIAVYDGIHISAAEDNVLQRSRRLIGGEDIPQGMPFVAVLAYKDAPGAGPRPYSVVCTATILHARWVLANAHCRDGNITFMRPNENMYVVLGLQDNSFGADQSNVQEFPIDQMSVIDFRHPDYKSSPVLSNDIHLLLISGGATLNQYVQPVELPPEDINDRKKTSCTMYSWGVTSEPVTDESFSRYLRSGKMALTTLKQCENYFFGYIGVDHLCAVGKQGAVPCFGDSGSPLFCKVKKTTYFFGIDSFGRRPACQGKPIQVFVRIKIFAEWITDLMDMY